MKQVKQTQMCVQATGSGEGTSLPFRCTLEPRGTLLKRLVVHWVRVCVCANILLLLAKWEHFLWKVSLLADPHNSKACVRLANVLCQWKSPQREEYEDVCVCLCVFWGSQKSFLFRSLLPLLPRLSFYVWGHCSSCHLVSPSPHQPLTNTHSGLHIRQ